MFATILNGNYLTYMTKSGWHSVDAHFQNGAETVSLFVFPIKTANTLILNGRSQISAELPNLQDQKSLTLRWRSFPEWGSDWVAICFANKDCQHVGFALQWPIQHSITLLIRPKIVDAPLTLILMQCQVKICCHWWLYGWLFELIRSFLGWLRLDHVALVIFWHGSLSLF